MISVGARRSLRTYFWLIFWSVVAGSVYGGIAGWIALREAVEGVSVGAIRGLTISAIIGALELFFTRTRWGRVVERAPFLVTFGVKFVVYGAVVIAAEALHLGNRLVGATVPEGAFEGPMAPMSIAFSFAATFAFLFLLQMSRLVGGRTLAAIIRGRYHRPHAEDRFFLFVDITGSTGIAERLGPAATHRYLSRVFRIAADPITDHRGEIYQYVGDEVVVTWTRRAGAIDARPIACFFAIEAALAEAAPAFVRDFATPPRVRASLHAGPVIAGEVGDEKREIVFHGDVMNTAARLEQLTRDLDRRFVVSEDALGWTTGLEPYVLEDVGPQALRGRQRAIRVFAVESKPR